MISTPMKTIPFLLLVAGLAALAGCGTKTHIVEGTVTLDGAPVDGATIVFMPEGGQGQQGVGITDAAGKFQLNNSSSKDGGLPAGTYKVLVTKVKAVSEEISELAKTDVTAAMSKAGEKQAKAAAMSPAAKYAMMSKGGGPKAVAQKSANTLPTKYETAENTPVSIAVPHDGPVTIALTKK
jgi:hypothetical protein